MPAELDVDQPGPLGDAARAELIGAQALCLIELGRADEAAEACERALALDPDSPRALEAAERLP